MSELDANSIHATSLKPNLMIMEAIVSTMCVLNISNQLLELLRVGRAKAESHSAPEYYIYIFFELASNVSYVFLKTKMKS